MLRPIFRAASFLPPYSPALSLSFGLVLFSPFLQRLLLQRDSLDDISLIVHGTTLNALGHYHIFDRIVALCHEPIGIDMSYF